MLRITQLTIYRVTVSPLLGLTVVHWFVINGVIFLNKNNSFVKIC